MKNKKASAYIGMVIYAVLVGFTFIFVKNSTDVASPLETMTFRFAAAMLPFIVLLIAGKLKVSIKGKSKIAILFEALTYVGFLGFQAFGLRYTTSIVSGILFAMVPVFARIAGGIILREKTTALQNVCMCMSVAAVIAMFVIGSIDTLAAIDWRGFVLLAVSSICCAVSNVLMRHVKREYKPLEISFISCLLGFIIFALMSIVTNTVNGTWSTFFEPLKNTGFLVGVLYLGIFCTFVTGVLVSRSLRHLPAVNATIWGNVSAAISVVAGALVLGEPLHVYQIICTVVIIAGVLGISFLGSKKRD